MIDVRSRPMARPKLASFRGSPVSHAGRAGFVAALIMLGVQLLWRNEWSKGGMIHSFPEFIVAAVARLTPLSLFGAITENVDSLAKKSLFVTILVATAAVGYGAGVLAERLSRRIAPGIVGRLAAGFAVTGGLILVTGLVVLPVSHNGVFATDNSHTGGVLLRLTVTFAIYAVVWALLATTAVDGKAAPASEPVSRRVALRRGAWGVATLAALAGLGSTSWRLLNPAKEVVSDDPLGIVAQQRAAEVQPATAGPTPTRVAGAAVQDVAALNAVDAEQDSTALFAQLDAEQKLTPVLTAVDDFYHVSKNLSDPDVDGKAWTLKVFGLVDRELELTYDEIVVRATRQNITTLCCISNELNGDLISTAEWTGVPLAELLDEAGIKEGAVDLKFHCADDYEDSIPVAQGLDPDTMVVIGMNGEPLPRDHGAPARMIVPAIYGFKNVKWLQSIELVDDDFKGYWQTRGWSDPAPYQIWGRIDYPVRSIPPGPAIAYGLASAGDRDIGRVEVSLDDGQTWADAILEPSLNPPFTWVRWVYRFEAQPGSEFSMRIRATDGTGAVAPQERRPPLPDGTTGWPGRKVKVKDG